MGPLEVKTYPDPCLRIRTTAVEEFNRDIENTLKSMTDVMYANQGIGLAATQAGLGLSIFVIDTGEGLINFVNPEILERSKKKSGMEEGCLSLPGVTVRVSRPGEVKVRARDGKGEFFIKKFTGLAARAIQHEFDHLQGKLIIDYLDPVRYFFAARKLSGIKRARAAKACEVVCDVGKTNNRRA